MPPQAPSNICKESQDSHKNRIFEKRYTMRYSTSLLLGLISLIATLGTFSYAQTAPFTRGVNLSNWFQAGSATQIQFSRYTKTDFEQIQSLGCDVIRLPINLHGMTQGAPDYQLEPLFLTFLDSTVKWAEETGIHLILDNHSFDPAVNTDPAVEGVLTATWEQLAARYKDRSGRIYYEILNEPHGIDDGIWGAIQGRVVDAIRAIDTKHTLIVGPANWNSFYNLDQMPTYADTNLIYTFHFYDPFLFTHQGATWVGIPLEDLSNMPFPYDANDMPALPASLSSTWAAGGYNSYPNEGTVDHMRQLLEIAASFSQNRGVPVFCGEFGVYKPNSEEDDRVRWYDAIESILDSADIAWTMWDYHGGFGIFNEGSAGLFDHDLNVDLLNALGLNVPPQSPWAPVPDTLGLFFYRDYIEPGIYDASGVTGTLNYYAENQPNYGQYHISWENADQYNAVAFDLRPDRDFSYLLTNGFALDFFARAEGGLANQPLDVRFLDTKTGPTDRPWRMNTSITIPGPDWEHYHIPLSSFAEMGSWDDNTWWNPEGLFDWQAIDQLAFVAETGGFTGTIVLDHIQLTDLDTAQINTSIFTVSPDNESLATVYPNPFSHQLTIQLEESQEVWQVQVRDVMGRLLVQNNLRTHLALDLSELASGMYMLELQGENGQKLSKQVWKE